LAIGIGRRRRRRDVDHARHEVPADRGVGVVVGVDGVDGALKDPGGDRGADREAVAADFAAGACSSRETSNT
jgi:hypothetical protein